MALECKSAVNYDPEAFMLMLHLYLLPIGINLELAPESLILQLGYYYLSFSTVYW